MGYVIVGLWWILRTAVAVSCVIFSYWLYPAVWYLEFGLCFSLWWEDSGEKTKLLKQPLIKLVVLVLILFPTLQQIKVNSYFYMNVNQYNNGSGITDSAV